MTVIGYYWVNLHQPKVAQKDVSSKVIDDEEILPIGSLNPTAILDFNKQLVNPSS